MSSIVNGRLLRSESPLSKGLRLLADDERKCVKSAKYRQELKKSSLHTQIREIGSLILEINAAIRNNKIHFPEQASEYNEGLIEARKSLNEAIANLAIRITKQNQKR